MLYGQVTAFLMLVIPALIVFYMAFLLVIRPPKAVPLASLLGGLITGVVNALVDIAAYHLSWWHYTLPETILHVPLPFYASSVLIFGSLAYLLIWRLWSGSYRWFAYLLVVGVPIFCIGRDIMRYLDKSSFVAVDNLPMTLLMTIIMWLWRLAPLS
jgi:hypothetical protein